MTDFVTALGLVLVVEGLLLALFPAAMQRVMKTISEAPPEMLRNAGVIGAIIGVMVTYATRKWFG